jgi:hypothetical protein
MDDSSRLIREMAQRAWKLIKDEGYQNEVQKPQYKAMREMLGHDPQKGRFGRVPDTGKLGTLDCPIGVNGVYGEVAYLSLLRTDHGSPLAFHRTGSTSAPNGSRVDCYELLSLDLRTRVSFFLDPYFLNRAQQAPKGFTIAKDFMLRNPIFGTHENVDGFPVGISHATREFQKKAYGCPLPVDALRQFEGLLTQG